MEQTALLQGQQMASFRSNLKQLMFNKSAEDGKRITQTDVAREAGVSFATVQRLYDDTSTFKRVDADTLYGLRDYFKCSFDDLLERVDE